MVVSLWCLDLLPSTSPIGGSGSGALMNICSHRINPLEYSLPEPVEGDSLFRTVAIGITGFHFIAPCAVAGRPDGA